MNSLFWSLRKFVDDVSLCIVLIRYIETYPARVCASVSDCLFVSFSLCPPVRLSVCLLVGSSACESLHDCRPLPSPLTERSHYPILLFSCILKFNSLSLCTTSFFSSS